MQRTPRQAFVRRTYLLFAVSATLALMLLCAGLYVRLTGLAWNSPLHEQSSAVQIGFLLALLVPIPFGFSIGGWAWSRIAKRFLRITRQDMEELLLTGSVRIGCLDRANRRAIDKLFGEQGNG